MDPQGGCNDSSYCHMNNMDLESSNFLKKKKKKKKSRNKNKNGRINSKV